MALLWALAVVQAFLEDVLVLYKGATWEETCCGFFYSRFACRPTVCTSPVHSSSLLHHESCRKISNRVQRLQWTRKSKNALQHAIKKHLWNRTRGRVKRKTNLLPYLINGCHRSNLISTVERSTDGIMFTRIQSGFSFSSRSPLGV